MKLKMILLGSVAALAAVQQAQAADAIVASEPEAMEYVRVCDAFGAGYFYIPGSETCLKIGGYVRFETSFGDDPYTGDDIGWSGFSRGTIRLDARSNTEYGELRSFIELRSQASDGSGSTYINSAYIDIAGFRAGYDDSRFDTWLNSAGNIINDDVIDYTGDRTNQASYVYEGSNGFSALIGLEAGDGEYDTGFGDVTARYTDSDTPHILGGLRYEQDWGGIGAVAGYDTHAEAFGGKVRLDVKFNDVFSVFVMGGYQSDWDNDKGPGGTRRLNYYGPWYGDWAAWGGFSATLNDKASLNGQVAYEDDGTLAAALNVEYEVVKDLTVMPELNYTDFDGERGSGEAFGGILRFQRNF
ncbi:porin [Pararhizobium gei]|uniref:porin n=1 Tax=Pararhizobium gei TaxID=1395951 RepID=UPI0023DC13AC|nr:porin [Rhizobium gei]